MPKKPPAPKPEQMLADAARISPQQIWQAGLGAFIKAQEEGDRAFARLVQDGSELQARERAAREESDASGDPAAAPTSWTRLEQMFEDRVARALAAMDVPTHRDLEELRERIDELTRRLDQAGVKVPKKASGKNTAVKKAAVKKATAKKGTAKKAMAKKAMAKKETPGKAAGKQA